MCCGLSGILYLLEMGEEKDQPQELGQAKFDGKGSNNVVCQCVCCIQFFKLAATLFLIADFVF